MLSGLVPVDFKVNADQDFDKNEIDLLKTTELRANQMQQERDQIQHMYESTSNQVISCTLYAYHIISNIKIGILETKLMDRDNEINRIGLQLEIARTNQFAELNESKEDCMINTDNTGSRYLLVKKRVEQLEYQIDNLQDYIGTLEVKCTNFVKEREAIANAHDNEIIQTQIILKKELENNENLTRNIGKLEKWNKELDKSLSKTGLDIFYITLILSSRGLC